MARALCPAFLCISEPTIDGVPRPKNSLTRRRQVPLQPETLSVYYAHELVYICHFHSAFLSRSVKAVGTQKSSQAWHRGLNQIHHLLVDSD